MSVNEVTEGDNELILTDDELGSKGKLGVMVSDTERVGSTVKLEVG